jgi:hypothetical protein
LFIKKQKNVSYMEEKNEVETGPCKKGIGRSCRTKVPAGDLLHGMLAEFLHLSTLDLILTQRKGTWLSSF